MIFTCKIDRVLSDKKGSIVSFIIPTYQAKSIDELNAELEYKLELTPIKSKRSLFQNKYMWALINEIAQIEGMDKDEVYCQIIKMANIKIEFIETIPEAIEKLRKLFRVIIERETRTSSKGVKTVMLECYYGSSTFDTKEMSEFIERLMDYAQQVGINTVEYR